MPHLDTCLRSKVLQIKLLLLLVDSRAGPLQRLEGARLGRLDHLRERALHLNSNWIQAINPCNRTLRHHQVPDKRVRIPQIKLILLRDLGPRPLKVYLL